MKNLYFLLLCFSGVAFAQPVIQSPANVHFCDENNDGVGMFDLTSNDNIVLGALDPSSHTLGYFETLVDAESFNNPILVPTMYTNIELSVQTIYVGVFQNSAPGMISTASFEVIVNPFPEVQDVADLTVYEDPSDGMAIFDLTSQTPLILNGQSGLNVFYYTSEADAAAGANPIAFDDSYENMTNPEQIWFRVSNPATGCFTLGSFNLIVTQDGNVFIPDVNFKTRLIALGFDSNFDGEIQYSEALQGDISMLVDNANISDMTGIHAFTNIGDLNCSGNNIIELDLSMQAHLAVLDCSDNPMTILTLNSASPLMQIDVTETDISALDLSGLSSLQQLFASNANIMDLNLTGCTSLVNISMNSALLGFVDLSTCSALTQASFNNNNLMGIEFGNNPVLSTLQLDNNQLFSIDVSDVPSLTSLSCQNNAISTADFSGSTFLQALAMQGNDLNTIDLSNSPNLVVLTLDNNPLLQTVFIKNGSNEDILTMTGSPVNFICADESQLVNVQAVAGPAVSVSSYCSFTPGGDYNTINGVITYDIDGNGCSDTDPVFPFVKIQLTGPGGDGASFSTADGSYSFYTQDGNYSLAPAVENASYFNVLPPVAVGFPTVNNSVVTQNFCIVPNGVHSDAEIVISPIVAANPGFDAVYQISYKNKGNQTLSGSFNFSYDETVLDLVSASLAPATQLPGSLAWSFSNLLPFESRNLYVTLNVNAPTDTPPVNIDDILDFTSVITLASGTEETPADNTFDYHQLVIGSYDPNDKTCVQGEIVGIDQIGEYLHYIINFENTGTAPAQNIVVRDLINQLQFDIATLQIVSSSHPVVARRNGNLAEFIFEGINLDSGGHGNILLKIKTLSTLANGATVTNKADIYFDYNFPIETNDANTTFQNLKVSDHGTMNLTVHPNPARTRFLVESDTVIESVQLYDIQGRLLQTSVGQGFTVDVDVSERSSGMYFVKVNSANAGTTIKIIIE